MIRAIRLFTVKWYKPKILTAFNIFIAFFVFEVVAIAADMTNELGNRTLPLALSVSLATTTLFATT